MGAGFVITASDEDNYHPLPNAFGFFPPDATEQHNFGRLGTGGDLQMAIDRDNYVEFALTPDTGSRISLTGIETGLTYPYCEATLQIALRYRIGSGDWQDAPTGPFAAPGEVWIDGEIGATEVSFDLSSVTALSDVGETVTFRLYIYSLETDARFCRAGLMRNSGPALVVSGTYTPPTPPQNLYQYIFGHSLINWLPHDIPLPYPPESHTSTPYWVYQFAQEAGHDYAVDGRFGFHPDYVARDQWPPTDGWSFAGVPQRRDPADPDALFDFATAGIDHVMFTALNFGQWRGPTEPLPWEGAIDGPSVQAYSIELIDLVRETAGDMPIYVYENWPDMAAYWPDGQSEPTAPALADYYAHATGDFQDWWTRLHDGLRAARPNVRSIPVGSILMRLLSETVLDGIPASDLYYDSAPHGTANLYFLAAMIQYAAIFEETLPETYTPPTNIDPLIANNIPMINNFIWTALNAYTAPDGTNRVFDNVPAQTPPSGSRPGATPPSPPPRLPPVTPHPPPIPSAPALPTGNTSSSGATPAANAPCRPRWPSHPAPKATA